VADGGAASLTQDPAARIHVSDEVLERFPSFRLRVLYAFGIRNRPSDATSGEWLREGASRGLAAHPHVKLWRDAYDAYNAVSLAHLLPIGGEDLDRLVGPCVLRLATSKDADVDPATAADAPKPGEVIWADDVGWTCRRWNWRQGPRTRLTESTRNAYFIIEGMAPALTETELDEAARELAERIAATLSPQHQQMVRVV
jgi:DNA/RNA-binding domain of Phe-tRNA-synthetase-like protein